MVIHAKSPAGCAGLFQLSRILGGRQSEPLTFWLHSVVRPSAVTDSHNRHDSALTMPDETAREWLR